MITVTAPPTAATAATQLPACESCMLRPGTLKVSYPDATTFQVCSGCVDAVLVKLRPAGPVEQSAPAVRR